MYSCYHSSKPTHKKKKRKWKTREFVGCVFAFVFLNCLTYSNDTTSSGSSEQSNDPGWLKNMFVKNNGTAIVKPGFVPMKSDFNVPTDGLPATTLKSRKAGRSLRWGDGVELIFFLKKNEKYFIGWKKNLFYVFRNLFLDFFEATECEDFQLCGQIRIWKR